MNRRGLLQRLAALIVAPAVTKISTPEVAAAPIADTVHLNLWTNTGTQFSRQTFTNNARATSSCAVPGCTIGYFHGHMDDSTFGKRPPDEDGALVA